MTRKTTITTVLGTALTGATLMATPAGAQSVDETYMNTVFNHTVDGHTLHYQTVMTGVQHQLVDPKTGETEPRGEPTFLNIDFGDGTSPDGADGGGGQACSTKSPLERINVSMPSSTHTYAKSGTYTVTVTSSYCGESGETEQSETYTVVVKDGVESVTPTAPSSSTPAQPTKAGPKVDTDYVGKSGSDLPLWAAVGGFGAVAMGGLSVAKRRRN